MSEKLCVLSCGNTISKYNRQSQLIHCKMYNREAQKRQAKVSCYNKLNPLSEKLCVFSCGNRKSRLIPYKCTIDRKAKV
jgi:hypothetical protein